VKKQETKAIPKIDDRSPSSTIMDLQRRLEQVPSPKSNPGSSHSIPMAHKEYEKHLRQLELECRNHIKVEQQMKLHIETLQEKLFQSRKEVERLNKLIGQKIEEHGMVSERFNSLINKLESELKAAQDKY